MEERTPCAFCENFEASCFRAQGKIQAFNFCPVCGRPYTPEGAEMLSGREKPDFNRAGSRQK